LCNSTYIVYRLLNIYRHIVYMTIHTMYPILLYIGYFGPKILLLLSLIVSMSHKMVILGIILGSSINYMINSTLKKIIKEPRPSQTYHYVSADLNEKTSKTTKLGTQSYGMPSGHSQNVWFYTSFMYFTFRNLYITLLFTGVAIITSIQRVVYLNHTSKQVVVGCVLGLLLGYIMTKIMVILVPYIKKTAIFHTFDARKVYW
jgi:membrane-associated phospholipid phosphatase